MAHPFTTLPTLREFIEAAVEQGCKVEILDGIIGPRGRVRTRYLVGPGEKGAIAILPRMNSNDRLTPTMIAQLVRTLRVTGFDHCYAEDFKDYDFVEVSDDGGEED